jgi:glycosyltransferase involved in cell wall biosynthesis
VKITAYIPCRNGEKTLPEVVAALRQQIRPADQLLFVNDHCTDQSPTLARESGFEILSVPDPGGLAAGRNLALRHASGDVLLGIDADVVIDPNYVQEMEKKFLAHPNLAALCGRLDERFKDTPADLWRAVHMHQHFGPDERPNPKVLFGANSACRVAVLKQINGWNQRFRTNLEDLDLTNRLIKAGFSCLYFPVCQAWHLRRDTPLSVLRSFWNWNNVDYDHYFTSIEDWTRQRLQDIWQEFRRYRAVDLPHPLLRPVTLLFPFVFTIRDLAALQQRIPVIGHIPDVLPIAKQVLSQYGMPPKQLDAFGNLLSQLLSELSIPASNPQPLHPQIANLLRTWAQESIPDANYWQDFSY